MAYLCSWASALPDSNAHSMRKRMIPGIIQPASSISTPRLHRISSSGGCLSSSRRVGKDHQELFDRRWESPTPWHAVTSAWHVVARGVDTGRFISVDMAVTDAGQMRIVSQSLRGPRAMLCRRRGHVLVRRRNSATTAHRGNKAPGRRSCCDAESTLIQRRHNVVCRAGRNSGPWQRKQMQSSIADLC